MFGKKKKEDIISVDLSEISADETNAKEYPQEAEDDKETSDEQSITSTDVSSKKDERKKKKRNKKQKNVKEEVTCEDEDDELIKKAPWFKDQMKIGIVLIIVSVISLLVASPILNYLTKQDVTTAVIAIKDIKQSPMPLTEDMFQTVEMPKNTLLPIHCKSIDDVVGKYASSDFAKGEIISTMKISKTVPFENAYLYNLPQGKKALSVELKGIAASISGKIQNGDIVSVYYCYDYEDKEHKKLSEFASELCPQLTYVKVLAVTNDDGTDIYEYNKSELEEAIPATVTLLVNDIQAEILVGLQQNSGIHLALVTRGNEALSNAYLEMQDDIIATAKEEEIKEDSNAPLVSIVEETEETNE